MTERPATPNLHLPQEEAAHRELGETRVAPGLARTIVALFVATLVAAPVLELALDRKGAPGVGAVFEELTQGPIDACALQRTETQMEERSEVARRTRPVVQAWLTRVFGVGNEQVYAAADGWLYQRAGFDHVTGPPFLGAGRLASKRKDADPCDRVPEADPLPAILQFHRDLERRGIALVVVPTPVKGVVDARPWGSASSTPAHNPSFGPFVEALVGEGVAVFDPTPVLAAWQDARPHRSAYLATDTHWRPEAMEAVAAALARFLEANVSLGERQPVGERRRVDVENRGDLAALLELDPTANPFALERVSIQEVRDDEGRLWKPSRGAPVLLLGDSFTNIYAVRRAFAQVEDGLPLDWGEAAGLAEQLSHSLARPVDRIARNAGGAQATRRDLLRQLARDRTRLEGVRTVVWQFAVRELSSGDWPVLPLPEP